MILTEQPGSSQTSTFMQHAYLYVKPMPSANNCSADSPSSTGPFVQLVYAIITTGMAVAYSGSSDN